MHPIDANAMQPKMPFPCRVIAECLAALGALVARLSRMAPHVS